MCPALRARSNAQREIERSSSICIQRLPGDIRSSSNDPYAQPAQFFVAELKPSVTTILAPARISRTSWLGFWAEQAASGERRAAPGQLQPQTPSDKRGGSFSGHPSTNPSTKPQQQLSTPAKRHTATMEAKGSEDETKDSKEEEPPSKVVIDLLNFAMRVVHEEMSGFFEQPGRGVPRCCGAFTPSS